MASKPALACVGCGVGGGGPHEVVRPAQEVLVGGGIEAQQVGDDHERERRRHVPHEVARAHLADAIDDAAAQGADLGLHLGDTAGREPSVHQPRRALCSGSSMEIIIGRCMPCGRGARKLEKVAGSFSMASTSSCFDDAPDVGRLVVVDGRVLAHPAPDLVGVVRVPVAVEEVEPGPAGVGRAHVLLYGRGNPQRRWAMMLRWISLVPP